MAKAAKKVKVVGKGDLSPTITGMKADVIIVDDVADIACRCCAHSVDTAHGLICGVQLPKWVKRSERITDNIVRPNDRCDLYKQGW